MSKEFIPHEEALALLELGFYDNLLVADHILYQQAFRWFRDNYEYHHYIEPIWRDSKIRYEWCVDDTADSEKDWEEEQICKTYEEAELACLKKLIEIVN